MMPCGWNCNRFDSLGNRLLSPTDLRLDLRCLMGPPLVLYSLALLCTDCHSDCIGIAGLVKDSLIATRFVKGILDCICLLQIHDRRTKLARPPLWLFLLYELGLVSVWQGRWVVFGDANDETASSPSWFYRLRQFRSPNATGLRWDLRLRLNCVDCDVWLRRLSGVTGLNEFWSIIARFC